MDNLANLIKRNSVLIDGDIENMRDIAESHEKVRDRALDYI